MRAAFKIALTTGKVVVMVRLAVPEYLKALRAGGKGAGFAAGIETTLAGLRMAIREVDGKPISFVQLLGTQWDKQFSMRETMTLVAQYSAIHSPPEGATKAAMDAESGGVYPVEGIGTVTLRQLSFGQASASLVLADKEPNTNAGQYMIALDGLRASLREVNGEPMVWPADWLEAWPFDVPTTAVLVELWNSLHIPSADDRPTVVPTTA